MLSLRLLASGLAILILTGCQTHERTRLQRLSGTTFPSAANAGSEEDARRALNQKQAQRALNFRAGDVAASFFEAFVQPPSTFVEVQSQSTQNTQRAESPRVSQMMLVPVSGVGQSFPGPKIHSSPNESSTAFLPAINEEPTLELDDPDVDLESPPTLEQITTTKDSQVAAKDKDYSNLPFAMPVPGKAGYVILPGGDFEDSYIDVRGVQPGTPMEVANPNDAGSVIQFRVP